MNASYKQIILIAQIELFCAKKIAEFRWLHDFVSLASNQAGNCLAAKHTLILSLLPLRRPTHLSQQHNPNLSTPSLHSSGIHTAYFAFAYERFEEQEKRSHMAV